MFSLIDEFIYTEKWGSPKLFWTVNGFLFWMGYPSLCLIYACMTYSLIDYYNEVDLYEEIEKDERYYQEQGYIEDYYEIPIDNDNEPPSIAELYGPDAYIFDIESLDPLILHNSIPINKEKFKNFFVEPAVVKGTLFATTNLFCANKFRGKIILPSSLNLQESGLEANDSKLPQQNNLEYGETRLDYIFPLKELDNLFWFERESDLSFWFEKQAVSDFHTDEFDTQILADVNVAALEKELRLSAVKEDYNSPEKELKQDYKWSEPAVDLSGEKEKLTDFELVEQNQQFISYYNSWQYIYGSVYQVQENAFKSQYSDPRNDYLKRWGLGGLSQSDIKNMIAVGTIPMEYALEIFNGSRTYAGAQARANKSMIYGMSAKAFKLFLKREAGQKRFVYKQPEFSPLFEDALEPAAYLERYRLVQPAYVAPIWFKNTCEYHAYIDYINQLLLAENKDWELKYTINIDAKIERTPVHTVSAASILFVANQTMPTSFKKPSFHRLWPSRFSKEWDEKWPYFAKFLTTDAEMHPLPYTSHESWNVALSEFWSDAVCLQNNKFFNFALFKKNFSDGSVIMPWYVFNFLKKNSQVSVETDRWAQLKHDWHRSRYDIAENEFSVHDNSLKHNNKDEDLF